VKENQLTIRQHLLELRKRLIWSVISVLICTGVSFALHEQILTFLMAPAEGFVDIPNQKPIYTDLTEYLGVAMKVSLLGGMFLSLPMILFQTVLFISPGLKTRERRYLYALMPVSLLAFTVGATFGYQILFPPAVKFLLDFGSDVATPYIRISNYTGLMLRLLFWMGIVFETPVVLFFLSKIGIVNSKFLAKQRRYAVLIAFVLGAIITPTFDPINQTLVALPIIVLYESGIWITKFSGRKKVK